MDQGEHIHLDEHYSDNIDSTDEDFLPREDEKEFSDDNSCDVDLEEEDNEICGDDGELNVKVYVDPMLETTRGDMVKQEVMGYQFDVDTDYDESDNFSSLEEDSDVEKERFPKFNVKTDMGNPVFKKGMIFSSFSELKNAIRKYSLKNRVCVTITKNDLTRVRAVCKEGCPWVLHASRAQRGERVQIKTYVDDHNCSREFSNQFATYQWIAQEYLEKIRSNPEIKVQALVEEIKADYNLKVHTSKARRAKRYALQLLRGDEVDQFKKLANYAGELRSTNPGSSVIFRLDNLLFQRMFICISGCISGFLAGCRPIISIDGCFLKGKYGGQLLSAIAVDPNDCIWPIAYAVVDVECKDTWAWFLQLLGEQLGIENSHGWTFMSDRQKGLIQAVHELYPNAEHRFCVRHLISNFKKMYSEEAMKNTIWAAARSTYMGDYNKNMEKLKVLSADAWAWIDAIPANTWSRSHFKEQSKCDILLNNMSECFNRFILDARDKPILSMLEIIRSKIMVRIAIKREKMESWTGRLCPKIVKKLEKNKDDSRFCWPIPSGGSQFQVSCFGAQFVVDLDAFTCSCRKWQLTGIPCIHACATLAHNGNKIEDFVADCYTIDTCKRVYANIVRPIRSVDQWDDVHHNAIQPPTSGQAKRGRPKKKRRREAGEAAPTGKMRRSGVVIHCTKCGGPGHNKKSCKNQGSSQPSRHASQAQATQVEASIGRS